LEPDFSRMGIALSWVRLHDDTQQRSPVGALGRRRGLM